MLEALPLRLLTSGIVLGVRVIFSVNQTKVDCCLDLRQTPQK